MKNFTFKSFMILTVMTSLCHHAFSFTGSILFSARLDGLQEIPAVETSGVGVAAFTLSADRDSLCVNITVNGLSGPITGAHIHSGAMGSTGGVLLDLGDFFVSLTSATGVITGSDLTPAIITSMLNGMTYVNIHTALNPDGELRGQITPETDVQFVADLTADQQNPPVVSDAMGLGTFTLSRNASRLHIHVVADGLSGPITGAHIHNGAAGTNGPVVFDLTDFINGNSIVALIDPSANIVDLASGNLYINLHTDSLPDGEIRGQILFKHVLAFDSWLSGDEETPAVNTDAVGVADIQLNSTLDSLWYHVMWTDLTAQATGAHFHKGAPGTAGPVVLDISDNIDGNHTMGLLTGAEITDELIEDLMKGNLYLNIHNANHPDGEIRGQVWSVMREGYTALIEGGQQVPDVTTNALGTLVASASRDNMDLHYMIVADWLETEGMHFHQGLEGQNGGVIFDLTPSLNNNSAYGYWTSTMSTPYNEAMANLFRADSVYVNLHTSAFPDGQIRGQATGGFNCPSISTGINELSSINSALNFIPNPAIDNVRISIESAVSGKSEMRLTDMTGKIISVQQFNMHRGLNQFNLDVNGMDSGIYLVEIISSGQRLATGRLVHE